MTIEGVTNAGKKKRVSYLGSRYAICASGAASAWAKNVHTCFLVHCFKHARARSCAFTQSIHIVTSTLIHTAGKGKQPCGGRVLGPEHLAAENPQCGSRHVISL